MLKFAIVGPGKVGTAVAILLQERGFNLVGIAGREQSSTDNAAQRLGVPGTFNPWEITIGADLIFITTPDRVLQQVSKEIYRTGGFRSGQTVIHMSGALPANVLSSAQEAGAAVLSLHPLQSFADVEEAVKSLPGSFFCLEGDEEALQHGMQVVNAIEGEYFRLDSSLKPLYHTGAVIASNYLVAVLHWAIATFKQLGMTEQEATRAIGPLVRGTLNNIKMFGPVQALTGPIARGDDSTVARHLDNLRLYQAENEELYRELGLYTTKIACQKGTLSKEAEQELRQILLGG